MNRTKVLKIANGLKILYTVLYILCIVVTALMLLCSIVLSVMDNAGLWESEDFFEISGNFFNVTDVDLTSIETVVYGMAMTMLVIMLLYIFAARFYKYICTVGEVFDQTVIKKMRTLGILYIVLPLVANMIAGAVISGFTNFKLTVSNTPRLTLGIVYLILTVVFSYGADLKEGKTEEDEEAKHPFDEE